MNLHFPSLTKQISARDPILITIILICIVIPLIGLVSNFYIRFIIHIFMWIGLASSWLVIGGYAGYADFGHVAYFGVSAYMTTFAVLWAVPWPLAIIFGACWAVLLAATVGLPLLRLHGAYFAIGTWALAEALKQASIAFIEYTGGSRGITLPQPPAPLSLEYSYYLMLIAALGAVLTNIFIERSTLGYSLRAIAESDIAASVSGVNIVKDRLKAYLISAFWPGIIGGIYVMWLGIITPLDGFSALKTIEMVLYSLVGGLGSWVGPVIGSIVMLVVFEVLWTYFTEILYLIFLGILIIIFMILMPYGIWGLIKEKLIHKS